MPRNSSGTYSLYTPGNPVVTSTVISSTWANNTLADLASALTDSLSRSGDGGMQAPLELTNGAVGAPSLTWASETTSGWYRNGAGDFRFSVSATDRLAVSATGLSVTGSIITSTATGGSQGAGTINATAVYDDGVLLANQLPANPSTNIGLANVNGVAATFMRSDAAPALSQAITPVWTGNHEFAPSSGVPFNGTRSGVNGAGVAATVTIGTDGKTVADGNLIAFKMLNSSNASTNYAFIGSEITDATAGAESGTFDIYTRSAGSGPTKRVSVRPAGQIQAVDGSASTPTYSLTGDPDTGIYSPSAGGNDLWMALGGTGYPLGYRGMPSRTITTTDSTAATDNGRSILFTGAGSQTFTIDSDFGTASNLCVILNGGTGALSIAESLSGTMTWLNGSGTLSTGTRTLAIGGVATVWMVDANNAYIWGTGLS